MARIINTADLLETMHLDRNTTDWVYNGLDAAVTLEIRDELLKNLDNVTSNTYQFSLALQGPVLDMTMRGVLVDQVRRSEVLIDYKRQIKQLADQLTKIARDGIGFTDVVTKGTAEWWRSPTKLKNLLYDVMKLPPVKKRNAKGLWAPTTDRDALEKLDGYFIAGPVTQHLLALREFDKKRGFLETGLDPDGRIRANFNIAGTNTGRLASSMSDFGTGTNLQNVDRELRSVFVADPGWKFANLDLEQGDARNVGAICWNLFVDKLGEKVAGAYLDACESGDLHTYVCRMSRRDLPWTGDLKADREIAERIAYRQDSYRQLAKKLGHGTNYYGTPRTMAKHTKVDTPIIEQFQATYFTAFPVIGSYGHGPEADNWHNYVKRTIASEHSLTTMFGRRRRFFGRSGEDTTLREAIAYEPQSMTADEIDTGLLKVWRANRVVPLIQVHDSVLFAYREEEEDEIIPWLLETMKTKLVLARDREFTVPTEAKIGWNWGDYIDGDAVAKAIAKKERVPTINLDGLQKWKGADKRSRLQKPRTSARSLSDLLG